MSFEPGNAQPPAAVPPWNPGSWPKRLAVRILFFPFVALGNVSAFLFRRQPFVTSVQRRVLIKGVDIDRSLAIAEKEIKKGGFGAALAIWGIRDQVFTEPEAEAVSSLYFGHVDGIADYFGIWHLTWAISNIYRNGNAAVRAKLEAAYRDATRRARTAGGFADAHVNGPILMGDIHLPARSYVQAHVVAPGNRHYLQSLDDYKP